jgi:hypothetical protein
MRRLLGIREARVFLLGSGLSMLGDSAMFLVLGCARPRRDSWARSSTSSLNCLRA